jgi:hypothetical protein
MENAGFHGGNAQMTHQVPSLVHSIASWVRLEMSGGTVDSAITRSRPVTRYATRTRNKTVVDFESIGSGVSQSIATAAVLDLDIVVPRSASCGEMPKNQD